MKKVLSLLGLIAIFQWYHRHMPAGAVKLSMPAPECIDRCVLTEAGMLRLHRRTSTTEALP